MSNISKIVFALLLFGCSNSKDDLFTVLDGRETGIGFSNDLQDSRQLNILDYLYFYNGGGVAVGDINNDGLTDIFLAGNRVKNKLYLNQGDLVFKEITEQAGVAGNSDWNSGVAIADVNGDGWLDIYVCAVVGVNGFKGHNELYLNNGDGTFSERSKAFALDFQNYTTMAGFLDYDLDGDLDMYLLNHAIHNTDSFGKADIRNKRVEKSGDKLLRNDGDIFVDVSEKSGIYGGANGYGLGMAISDFDLDGYPDIYISNDFHEDDYFYRNKGDGAFEESGKTIFGHYSKFSMGSDVADVNHDGYPDLLTLDMLPGSEDVLKNSAGEDNQANLDQREQVLGYHPQYSRNMLHLNQNGKFFSEVGLMGNIAATDWSWSALFADFDLDAEQDLFITNGIPKRPNDLDYINFISNKEIQRKLSSTKAIDIEALERMPAGTVQNKFFKGNGTGLFGDYSKIWAGQDVFITNGAALADLDNDGDMDIITNNLNKNATIYRNNGHPERNYLKLKFQLNTGNAFGLGTKVALYHGGKLQYKELTTTRGFQSSSDPIMHFGMDKSKKADSLIIHWPNGSSEILYDLSVNETKLLSPSGATGDKPFPFLNAPPAQTKFEPVDLGLDFHHKENKYIDFNRQKLIPYKISNRGPALGVGDLNEDGKDDIFLGGSKHNPGTFYVQKEGAFHKMEIPVVMVDMKCEDENAVIADFNSDGRMDLMVGSGGGEYTGISEALLDRLYLATDQGFKKANMPNIHANTSVIEPHDFDQDGDLDVFIGVSAIPGDYGKLPTSYLLRNDHGRFYVEKIEGFKNIGMVTTALWTDFDDDQIKDLIIVGEWMSPLFFKNDGCKLFDVTGEKLKSELHGLWRTIHPFDIDKDGDLDYLLGNWGLNSKFKASSAYPLKMYYGDFDTNSFSETLIAVEKEGSYFPINGLGQLSEQLETLMKKQYSDFASFGGKTMDEIFGNEVLEKGQLMEVNTLASGILKNNGSSFDFKPFSDDLQCAPITCFLGFDFDFNGSEEVLAAGNFFGSEPFHGRFDAFQGAMILDEENTVLTHNLGLNLMNKAVTGLDILQMGKEYFLIVSVNSGEAECYQIKVPGF